MATKPLIPVLLTRRQAYLIIEQMDKGADAWDDAWARNCATKISKKIRGMIFMMDGVAAPPPESEKKGEL